MSAALRTALVLAGLALLMVIGVAWGFGQATKPFPKKPEAPICVETKYAAGETLKPGQVVVSVLNASDREGLAGRTLQLLNDQGFASGSTNNAPKGTTVTSAEIWTADRTDPGVRLLRSFVGKVPVREHSDLPYAGVDLVVGDQFGDLVAGKTSLTLKRDGTVCSPEVE